MIVQINHQTNYTYSQPVLLGPTTLRLTPRQDTTQLCRSISLQILPKPVYVYQYTDMHGNTGHTVCFQGETSSLSVAMSCEVETIRNNPFDFIVNDTRVLSLPVAYDTQTAASLYGACTGPDTIYCKELQDLVATLIDDSGLLTIDFLSRFSAWIAKEITYESRSLGAPRKVQETLLLGKGACRDTAMVFIEGCRLAGLAARFVSGYCADNLRSINNEHYLHAWAEVYIPGAGWRGYDPGSGLAVSDKHIAIAASPFPETAGPLDGAFKSAVSASTTLESNVSVTVIR